MGSERNFQFALQAAILALLIGVMIAVIGSMGLNTSVNSQAWQTVVKGE